MNIRDWVLRLRAVIRPLHTERELDAELASHIEHEIRKLVATGMGEDDARRVALARFGSIALVADQCRDARGTAFVDNTVRDLQCGWRLIRRAPAGSAAIVATVTVGLVMITGAFTAYNSLFLQDDAVRDGRELYTVRRPSRPGDATVWNAFTRRDLDALQRETSVFTDAAGTSLDRTSARIDGRPTDGVLVTGTFFQVLGLAAASGRTLLPDDDARGGRPLMVLSDRGWAHLFARAPDIIGRVVLVNGAAFEIVGIMPRGFRGLSSAALVPDYWMPLSVLSLVRPADAGKEDAADVEIVGRLKPGLSTRAATVALTAWVAADSSFKPRGHDPRTALLLPGVPWAVDLRRGLLAFSPVFFAFSLVLLIGCANVANLLLARGVARQREIGIRLSLGASRTRVVRQLLTESLMLAIIAAGVAIVVLRGAIELALLAAAGGLGSALADSMVFDVPTIDWRVLTFTVVVATIATALFGLAPALQATRLELVRTMRGEVGRDARPRRARSVLVVMQVAASVLLLIAATVFLRSAASRASASSGMRTSDVITIAAPNESLRPAIAQAVMADPAVVEWAASYPAPQHHIGIVELTGSSGQARPTAHRFVSPDYFDVLGINIIQGRGFTPREQTIDSGVVVVSEATARSLWPADDAIGQVVRITPTIGVAAARRTPDTFAGAPFVVIGVARDIRDQGAGGLGFGGFAFNGVYLPTNASMPATAFIVRARGDVERARRGLIDRLSGVDPAIGAITALDTIANRIGFVLRVLFWVTAVLGGLALALTLSGILSVLSYVVEQQRHEIGVRMALGAGSHQIVWAVLGQLARPVLVGLAIGVGLVGSVATALLASPAASTIGHTVRVLDPVSYVASVGLVLITCVMAGLIPAARAARIDPMSTLKRQ